MLQTAFNGVVTGYNEGFDRYAGQDMDVHDNLIRHQADDALEPELAAINFRAWNNRIEHSLTVLSTGPVHFGPIYLWTDPTFPKASVFINGMPACTVGAMGYFVHIPMGLPGPMAANCPYWKRYLTNVAMGLVLGVVAHPLSGAESTTLASG